MTTATPPRLPTRATLPDGVGVEDPERLPAPLPQPALEHGVEDYSFGLPTLWVVAAQIVIGCLLFGLGAAADGHPIPTILGIILLVAGVTAPFRRANEPYAVVIAPDGRVQFRLPLEELVVPAQAITMLTRATYTDSEGGVSHWLEVSTAHRELRIDAGNRDMADRLIGRLIRVNERVALRGAWLRE